MVTVETPDTDAADRLTDLWVALAEGQRAHGSHLLAAENRTRVRETVVRHAVDGTVRVAREGDAIVGFVTFTSETGKFAQDCDRGVVTNLFVSPAHRSEGVGATLLAAAERALADRGADRVALDVMAGNDRARSFYREAGYEPHRVTVEKQLESDTHSRDDE